MRGPLLRLGFVLYAIVIATLVVGSIPDRLAEAERLVKGRKLPAALGAKLARATRLSPGQPGTQEGGPTGWAEQYWLERSIDGAENGPPPFSAFATARNDWFGLLGRP